MLYKLCLFNTKTLYFFSLLKIDFSMKNRNLPPRFKLAEFVGVQKNKTKKKNLADRRSHQGVPIFLLQRFSLFKISFKIVINSILSLFFDFYSVVYVLNNLSCLKRIISIFYLLDFFFTVFFIEKICEKLLQKFVENK